jgi:hypothetical protein
MFHIYHSHEKNAISVEQEFNPLVSLLEQPKYTVNVNPKKANCICLEELYDGELFKSCRTIIRETLIGMLGKILQRMEFKGRVIDEGTIRVVFDFYTHYHNYVTNWDDGWYIEWADHPSVKGYKEFEKRGCYLDGFLEDVISECAWFNVVNQMVFHDENGDECVSDVPNIALPF